MTAALPKTLFTVFLHPQMPSDYESILGSFLRRHKGHKVVYCTAVHQVGMMLEMHMTKGEAAPPWPVQVPLGIVLAVADISSASNQVGFLSGAP